MTKEITKEQARKGVCPECGKDLDFDTEYNYAYCSCGYKIGGRELKIKQS